MKRKKLYFRAGPKDKPRRIATIELNGSAVTLRYAKGEEPFEALEELGTRDGLLRPRDGKRYFDALELAFATSSHYFVA